jgi:hypothetical protein
LILLSQEQIIKTCSEINLIGSESLTLGEMIITNIRIVWHSKQSQNNNISIPFIKVNTVNIKQTVHGDGVFIETKAMKENYIGTSTNYILYYILNYYNQILYENTLIFK